jgi:hypothetical protein
LWLSEVGGAIRIVSIKWGGRGSVFLSLGPRVSGGLTYRALCAFELIYGQIKLLPWVSSFSPGESPSSAIRCTSPS